MTRILLVHPSKWGRGITAIWVASHAAALKARRHEVRLFDATFFPDWAEDEVGFNTQNHQYQPTDYERMITWKAPGVAQALQALLDAYQPEVVFWSALSSHIHGEGEYVSIQYGCQLLADCCTKALKVCGGLQPTADLVGTFNRFPQLDALIAGESELPLADLADALRDNRATDAMPGLSRRQADGSLCLGARQPILRDLDLLGPYDYSLFEEQVFLRPYNGEVVKAVDYEMSRGCVFTCAYCVETVIQRYYGFTEANDRGVLKYAKAYLRCKSAPRVMEELTQLHLEHGITLIRAQDTNFLTIDRPTLLHLAELMEAARLPILLYIETRPEGVTKETIPLLKRLQVDGIGMGIELSGQEFRESQLNRYSDQTRIIEAFKLLRAAGIRRTAYNIIGLVGQDEDSILETISFNRQLDPDNVTVAFYSPFLGTRQQEEGVQEDFFNAYEVNVDPQLRTVSHHGGLPSHLLEFYKAHFKTLVEDGLEALPALKAKAGLG